MKRLSLFLFLLVAPSVVSVNRVHADAPAAAENDAGLRQTFLALVAEKTPQIERLRGELKAYGDGLIEAKRSDERAALRQQLFFALLSRGQGYEFSEQHENALVDYHNARYWGGLYNETSHWKQALNLAPANLGTARIYAAKKHWGDVSGYTYNVLNQEGHSREALPSELAEAYGLDVRSRFYGDDLGRALKVAQEMETKVSGDKKATALRYQGAALFLQGDIEGARAKWKAGSAVDGRFANIDPYDDNQAALNKAVFADGKNPEARLQRARYFAKRAGALENDDMDNFLDRVPGQPQTLDHQGGWENIAGLKNPTTSSFRSDALQDIEKALKVVSLKPSPTTAQLYLERARVRQGVKGSPVREVVEDYLEVLHLAPRDAGIAREAGLYFAKINSPLLALRGLSRSIALSPTPDASVVKKRDEIFAALPKKTVTHPATLQTALDWKNRGNEISADDPLNALDCYRKAVQIDPKFADGWNNIASVFSRYDMLDRQRDAFDRAIKIDPKHRIAYANRANTWNDLNEWEKAKADAEKGVAFATMPQLKASALAQLAGAKAGLNDLSGARSDLEAALELDADDVLVRRQKGYLELRMGNFVSASNEFEKVVAAQSGDAQSWAALAMARFFSAPKDLYSQPENVKVAWATGAKVATRADWQATIHLLLEMYQSGKPFNESPVAWRINELYNLALNARK